MAIDWRDPASHITEHFTVREALWLPQWHVFHLPSYVEQANIQIMANRMEEVRYVFHGVPVRVHCWIRPACANLKHPANGTRRNANDGKDYNAFVGGAPASMHLVGSAVDFHVDGYEGEAGCSDARKNLLSWLGQLGLRMEDKAGGWIHLDNKPVPAGGSRFFKP